MIIVRVSSSEKYEPKLGKKLAVHRLIFMTELSYIKNFDFKVHEIFCILGRTRQGLKQLVKAWVSPLWCELPYSSLHGAQTCHVAYYSIRLEPVAVVLLPQWLV